MWKQPELQKISKIQRFFRLLTLKESDGPRGVTILASKVFCERFCDTVHFGSLIKVPILGFLVCLRGQLKNELEEKMGFSVIGNFRP